MSTEDKKETNESIIDILQEYGLSSDTATQLGSKVTEIFESSDAPSIQWQKISKTLLTREIPFKIHEYLFRETYKNDKNNNYYWIPSENDINTANLTKLIKKSNKKNLTEYFNYVNNNRELFFKTIINELNINFIKRENDKIFDIKNGVTNIEYLPNTIMNAVDMILVGSDDRLAITWARETDLNRKNEPILNYIKMGELRKIVNQISYSLVNKLNLKKGDAIGIDMPMSWESVAIYLGIIKAGMIVISIADSFSSKQIEIRLKIGKAKCIFTQDIIPRGNKKIDLYNRILQCNNNIINNIQCIVLSHLGINNKLCVKLRKNDISWNEFLKNSKNEFNSIKMSSMDIANILFSSGTTGEPKAIPWLHNTFIKPLIDGYCHHNIKNGEVVAWPTNLGWMMGPWLLAQMGLGASIALYVGTPTGENFCKFVELSKINMLGVIPSMVKSWMKLDCTKNCDWSEITRYSSTGEASNPTLYHWLSIQSGYKPIFEYVGGTEIAGGYLSGCVLQPQLLSAFSLPCMGLNIHIIDEIGNEINNGEGELTISVPSIGLSTVLLNRNHYKVYYDGMPMLNSKIQLRRHGDAMRILPNGYYQHLGRIDDTMNIGGIKVSSIELENEITKHPLLSKECAAISYRKQEIDTEKLVICVVPKTNNITFDKIFNKKPLGITLARCVENNNMVIVSKSIKNNDILSGSLIYKINEKIVYGIEFDKIIDMLKNINQFPIKIQFIVGNFDLNKIKKELQVMVKNNINPLYRVHDLYVLGKLPRTASGKVMRRILRQEYAQSV